MWRRGPDMPFAMGGPVQSVQVRDTVYVGGGTATFADLDYIVMAYDTSAGKWATLPPYRTCWFAMTVIDDHLVLVGGSSHDDDSKVLGVWSEDSKKWTYPYPDMTITRRSCSAVVYKHWLVVAGGVGEDGWKLSSIEVMNTDTKQWHAGPSMPIAWSHMKMATVDNTCYFMGGNIKGNVFVDNVYSASLPALISQFNSNRYIKKDTQTWKEIPQLPVKGASPFSISGSLFAVGGWDKARKPVSAVHLYQPDAGQWVKVSDMPAPRHTCTSIMSTNKELLVAGGTHSVRIATMYTAHVYGNITA